MRGSPPASIGTPCLARISSSVTAQSTHRSLDRAVHSVDHHLESLIPFKDMKSFLVTNASEGKHQRSRFRCPGVLQLGFVCGASVIERMARSTSSRSPVSEAEDMTRSYLLVDSCPKPVRIGSAQARERSSKPSVFGASAPRSSKRFQNTAKRFRSATNSRISGRSAALRLTPLRTRL